MSEKRILQQGDVIELKEGMRVNALVPDYIFEKFSLAKSETRTSIQIGKLYESKKITLAEMVRDVSITLSHFGLESDTILEKKIENFLLDIPIDLTHKQFDSSILAGKYVVIHAPFPGINDDSKYHIFCQKLNSEKEIIVDFFQSSSYIPCIEDIEVIDKMKIKYE